MDGALRFRRDVLGSSLVDFTILVFDFYFVSDTGPESRLTWIGRSIIRSKSDLTCAEVTTNVSD
jgi:hypothetical protein